MIDFNDPELVKLVRETARSVSSNYNSYISQEDTEQTIWLWILKKRNSVDKLMRQESWEAKLRATITKVAHSACLEEDAAVHGYSSEDVFHYSIPVIRTLLLDAYDYENWQSFQTFGDGQPKSKGQANETGDRLAMLVDVKAAVERLPEDQYNLIIWAYKYQHSYTRLGEILGISPKAAQSRLERALGAVQRELGRKPLADLQRGHSARRKAYGNAEAGAITERMYNG